MKSYFLSGDEFRIFENGILEQNKKNFGTIVKINDKHVRLFDLIQKEISSIQLSKESCSFTQKAICIDCDGKEPSKVTLEECTVAIQERVPGWNLNVIRKLSKALPISICSTVPKSKMVRAAVKSGLIKFSNSSCRLWSSVSFIFLILLSTIVFKFAGYNIKIGIGSILPCCIVVSTYAIFSGIFYLFLKKQGYKKEQHFNMLESILKNEEKNTKAYETFVSMVANELTIQVPAAIVIEDSVSLDKLTVDVIENITRNESIQCIGVLLWIVLKSNDLSGVFAQSDKWSFSLSRYNITKVYDLKENN